jgi:hypothetical protein
MASEDSDHIGSGLLAIHRLSDFRDLYKALMRPVQARVDQSYAAGELFEVLLLRRAHSVRLEERNDRADQVRATSHRVSIQVLPVVVVPSVRQHAAHTEELHQLAQA